MGATTVLDTSISEGGGSASVSAHRPRPWRRYFARVIDMWIGGYAAGVILAIFSPGIYSNLLAADNPLLWVLVAGISVASLEGMAVSTFGRTPGKLLLGLRVEMENGARPSYGTALKRSFMVWWSGLAIGFPIVSLFAMARAKHRLEVDGITSWDRALGTRAVFGRK